MVVEVLLVVEKVVEVHVTTVAQVVEPVVEDVGKLKVSGDKLKSEEMTSKVITYLFFFI